MRNSNLIFCLIVVAMTSCCVSYIATSIHSFNVVYIKGSMDSKALSCDALFHFPNTKDTIISCDGSILDIEKQINYLKKLSVEDPINSCDVRLTCLIDFKSNKNCKLCIGKFNCIIFDGVRMEPNDTLAYLIKSKSGYYNYFSEDILMLFSEIKIFGIPSDYKDISLKNNIDCSPPPSVPR